MNEPDSHKIYGNVPDTPAKRVYEKLRTGKFTAAQLGTYCNLTIQAARSGLGVLQIRKYAYEDAGMWSLTEFGKNTRAPNFGELARGAKRKLDKIEHVQILDSFMRGAIINLEKPLRPVVIAETEAGSVYLEVEAG